MKELKKDCTPEEVQNRIKGILEGMTELLIDKNKKYGNSALAPKKIFSKADATDSIALRLDDKLGRIMNNPNPIPRVNDCADIIGYLTLMLISIGAEKEDILKLKD
jgi:hypothetical protein